VLSRDTGHRRAYGQNPYVGYDAKNGTPFLYDGPETPDVLPSMARVVAIDLNDEAVAYPYDVLEEVRVVNDAVGGTPVAVFWSPGTASALDASSIVEGDDVGSATTFSRELDGRTLTFVFEDGRIIDAETGTAWDVLGWAISGPQAGERLSPIVSVNYFWFSWAAFKPETRVYGADVPSSGPEAPSKPASAGLEADVEINLCQGEDVLGGESILFSEAFAQGKPVVLSLWAGLCPVGRIEMPELEQACAEYGDQVLFIGLDVGLFVDLGSQEDGLGRSIALGSQGDME
jgi:thiol-disulfide isomerase/thioredoxin